MVVVRIAGSAIALMLMLAVTTVMAKDTLSFSQGQSVRLAAFDELKVKGGGNVTLRPSSSWSVTVVQGADQVAMYTDGGDLLIECRRPCRANNRRVIEVRVPSLEAITIENGGVVQVASGFSGQENLTTSITGGGLIDAFALSANNVSATVRGGGTINITANRSLDATITGAGDVVYAGNPTRVNDRVTGTGTVRRR